MGKIQELLRPFIPQPILYEHFAKRFNNVEDLSFDELENRLSAKYKDIFGRPINWDSPSSYSEKLTVSKIYAPSADKTKDSDKVLVREKIAKLAGDEYLIPLIGVYDRLADVNYKELPESFVIKCNHDSASVTLIKNKNELSSSDWKKLVAKYDHFYLKRKFQRMNYELHYADITPKIVIEKYMGDGIKDFKFLCFSGTPAYVWIDNDRYGVRHTRDIYDMNWELQPFIHHDYPNSDAGEMKPENFDEMLNIVTLLSKGYDHVRTDMYDIDGHIYFGELTFSSGGGDARITPAEWDFRVGSLWDFDNSKRIDVKSRHHKISDFVKNW